MDNVMQLILADNGLNDICAVMDADIDFAVGSDENDFEVKLMRDQWNDNYTYGNVLYIKNTEYGGIIGEIETSTEEGTISLLGYTWRGLLGKKVIQPASGEDYATANGEVHEIITALIGSQFGSYFVVSDTNTGISFSSYQFDRYCTLLEGIEKMLSSVDYRLKIRYIQQERGLPGYIELSAVPIVDYSDQIELSQDSELNFTYNDTRNGVNHLICLGQGELADREVLHLYVQKDGTIGSTQHYTGLDEIVEVYDYSSGESEELESGGIERLQELMNSTSFTMDVASLDIDVDIGDIIGGRDYLTGMSMKQPITKKIYKVEDGTTSIEYEIEGDES